jgi:hypothetical protein
MGLMGGLLGGKEKGEKLVADVIKKDEMLRNEMIKAIRENLKESEKGRKDKTENRKVEKEVEGEMDVGVNEEYEEYEDENSNLDTSDLISNLKDEMENENIEMCHVLSAEIEEHGDVKPEELVELGRTILHEIEQTKINYRHRLTQIDTDYKDQQRQT